MPQPILYIAITNHGFGHAARTATLAAEIKRMCPEVLIILTTTAPRWLLESYLEDDFIHRPRALDVGVLQSDSVTMDKPATLEKLEQIRAQQDKIIASEVDFINQNRVGLLLADIPPIASLIAKAAGIPCWMASNFGWDLIYRPWGGKFIEISDWIVNCFSQCDQLFRLPLHEPMSAFPVVTDVGFTGGSPRYSLEELQQFFDLSIPPERTVLMTFGGLGLSQIPYHNLQHFPDWQFISFDDHAPDLPNLIKIPNSFKIGEHRCRPVDLMPACGRMLCKPGYGTFSEACRTGTPIVSITRDDFGEAPVLLESIQQHIPYQILPAIDFFNGKWEFLHQPLNSPRQSEPIITDGNKAIAQAVINFFQTA